MMHGPWDNKKNKLSAFKDRLQNKSFLWHNLMMKEGRKELPRLRDDSVSVYRAVGRSENQGGGAGGGGSSNVGA